MFAIIKVKFTKNHRPTPDILNLVQVYDTSPELYYIEKHYDTNQELDEFLRAINLHPSVQLAWLR